MTTRSEDTRIRRAGFRELLGAALLALSTLCLGLLAYFAFSMGAPETATVVVIYICGLTALVIFLLLSLLPPLLSLLVAFAYLFLAAILTQHILADERAPSRLFDAVHFESDEIPYPVEPWTIENGRD